MEKVNFYNKLGIQAWGLQTPNTSLDTTGEPKDPAIACTICGLHITRTQTGYADDQHTDLLIISESPGTVEDNRAATLLNSMLQSINISKDKVYISNTLKCKSHNHTDKQITGINSCAGFLKHQINFTKPKLILALGEITAHQLLNTEIPLGELRGKIHEYNNTPLIATYHPAYLLRNPKDKKNSFKDLLLTIETLNKI